MLGDSALQGSNVSRGGLTKAACYSEIIKHRAATPRAMGTNALVEGRQCSLIETLERAQHLNLVGEQWLNRLVISWNFLPKPLCVRRVDGLCECCGKIKRDSHKRIKRALVLMAENEFNQWK